MAVQRKLPTKLCECHIWKCQNSEKIKFSKAIFLCVANKISLKNLTNVLRYLTTFLDEITAHSQKVSCLDIGETGRVLVTGGNDRLVNLFAIGNEKSIQV